MAKHDELLQQGPRQAPEPETAEQRTGVSAGARLPAGLPQVARHSRSSAS